MSLIVPSPQRSTSTESDLQKANKWKDRTDSEVIPTEQSDRSSKIQSIWKGRKVVCIDVNGITDRLKTQEALLLQTERERLLRVFTQNIHQTLDLESILYTAVDEICKLLHVDRAIVHHLQPNGKGKVLMESIAPGCESILNWTLNDPWTADNYLIQQYHGGQVLAIDDTEVEDIEQAYKQLHDRFNIKAFLSIPILFSDRQLVVPSHSGNELDRATTKAGKSLWGMLILHQCSGSRQWQPLDIDLMTQLTKQLAIAIQKAELYQQLELANQELERRVHLDGLTQIANRLGFDRTIHQEWQRMAREESLLSLIMCDIDRFKDYNDTYGHLSGDECLRQVTRAIDGVLQRPGDMVARFGGEEIAVILPNTGIAGALRIAEKIRLAIRSLEIAHAKSPVSQYVRRLAKIT